MSIIIDSDTRVLIQGITGNEGRFWAKHSIDYGTNVVAGVTPGKEGELVENVPVYHTVRRAVKEHQIDASLLFVPPRFAMDAIFEALDGGIKTIVVTAEGLPLHQQIQIRKTALATGARIIGCNSTGLISTGKAMMGFFPYWLERVYKPGRIGVMTRSGSLTNEVTAEIVKAGFGTTSVVGVGGDPAPFTRFAELLPLFEKDRDTDAIVMIGEVGGTMEEEVADAIATGIFTKPLIAFMGGRTAPKGTKMGHAGAIITAGKGTVADKISALTNAGALVADRPSAIGKLLRIALA
jgi:succinyl-CoA synthetase alpha subunit